MSDGHVSQLTGTGPSGGGGASRRDDARVEQALFACLYRPPMPGGVHVSVSELERPTSDTGSSTLDGRSPTEERSRLTAIAADFSPRYEQHRADLVSIDVRGLSRLLGTPRTIGAELRREAASRGVRVHVAVAPTRTAALVLAVARPGLTVVTAASLAGVLASVPLGVLEQLPDDPLPGASAAAAQLRANEARAAMASLKRWGLRTLGELAALPAADLSARLGRGGHIWQAIARGEDLRPLVPMQPDERFDATMELEWPIEGIEPLSFVLTRLLEPLSTRLERRDRGVAVLHLQLGLVTREVHARRLELPSPLREVRALRTLALLDVETHPPAAAIDRVTIVIEPTPGRILQHALFARPHPTPEQLSTLLARLGALVGQDRIGAPATVDTHRPGAFAMAAFAIEHGGSAKSSGDRLQPPPSTLHPQPSIRSLPCALRRCRQPVPVRVTVGDNGRPLRVVSDRRGFPAGAVLTCAGPWRATGGWWEGTETSQFEVESETLGVTMAKAERGTRETFNREPRTGATLGAGAASTSAPRRGGAWNRDEWEVALADGAVYRIFRDHATDAWFIDGVID